MSETPSPRPDLDLSLFGDEHVRRYEETDGAEGYIWNGAPCAVLTTTGRKSGATRKSALIFGQDGDKYLLVGSQGGAPKHPMWYLNLRDNPDVELQVKGDKFAGTSAARDRRREAEALEDHDGALAVLRRLPGAHRA